MTVPQFSQPLCGCYFPTWAKNRPGKAAFNVSDIEPNLCTYLVVAFGKIESDELNVAEHADVEAFQQLNELRRRNPKLLILLAVGGWTLSSQIANVAKTPVSRQKFAISALKRLREWNLDGLDVDWEFPKTENKEEFSALLTDIRTVFNGEKPVRDRARLALTIAVTSVDHGGYDGTAINRACDVVHLMCYDLHGTWSNTIGHHAPLFKGPFATRSEQNVETIAKSWVAAGVDKRKLSIGIPCYGRGWSIASSENGEIGGSGIGPIPGCEFMNEAGSWPYYKIVKQMQLSGKVIVYDKNIHGAYACGDKFWIGFDTKESAAAKAKWVKSSGYGGVFIWEISQDDFGNLCGDGRYPLLRAIHSVLVSETECIAPVSESHNQGLVSHKSFYIVQKGDIAYNIARAHHLSLRQLEALNPDLKNPSLIHPGDKLLLEELQDATSSQKKKDSDSDFYTVRKGDFAYNIAVSHGITLDELEQLNPEKGSMELLQPGDRLFLERADVRSQASTLARSSQGQSTNVYVVKSGDFAYNIAITHGMTLDELRKLNSEKGSMELLHAGDKLFLKKSGDTLPHVRPDTSQGQNTNVYVVKGGDFAYGIAIKHGMSLDELRNLNPERGSMELLHPGDKLLLK